MQIRPIKLDTQFGLFDWGIIKSRPLISQSCDGAEYHTKLEGNSVILDKTDKEIEQGDFSPDAINSKSFIITEWNGNCYGEGRFESKQISVQAVDKIGSYSIPLTRDLILLMYQAYVERLGISRTMTDSNTVFEMAMNAEKPLTCEGFESWSFPDFGGRENCFISNKEMRRRAGGINQARVDGNTFREFMRLLCKFLNDAKKNDVLYPITPVVGTNNFPNASFFNPFSGGNSWTNVNQFGDGNVDIAQRWSDFKIKILGFASCGTGEVKGSWAGDITLSKGIEQLCIEEKSIDHIKQNSIIADIIKEVFKNAEFHDCDSYYNDNPIERFLELIKQEEPTALNDISGEYLNFANSPSKNTLRYHLPTYGYGWTVLGAFGQNVVRYPIEGFIFSNHKLYAERRIGYKFAEISDCSCNTAGFAIGLGNKFFTIVNTYDCRVFDEYNVGSDYTTAYAQVDGYGGAMPVINLDRKFIINDFNILKRLYDEAPTNCVQDCRFIDYNTMKFEQAIIEDFKYGLVDGELSFGLEAEWTNRDEDTCEVVLRSNRFTNRYPAQGVFGNMYKPFLRDVNVLYPVHNCNEILNSDQSGYDSRPMASLYFRPNVNTDNAKCWLEQDAQKVANESSTWVNQHRGKYVSTGLYTYYCTVRESGEDIPNEVITVDTFPITEIDVFGKGDNSLLSVKSWECFLGDMGEEGTIDVLQVKLKLNKEGLPIPIEALMKYRIQGVIFQGWEPLSQIGYYEYEVGMSQHFKSFRAFKCKYEPYMQTERHRVSIGSPFGIIRWNYQAAKGVI